MSVPPWLPAVFTAPLQENYCTDGPKLRDFVSRFWKTEDDKPFVLDDWQADLIDRVLERYPLNHPDPNKAGRLRYRQVVISVGRQNGKSVFAAIFGLYGLMMMGAGPTVIGLASNADQANIIYRRVKHVIDSNPVLKKRFKTTGTRGITRLDKTGLYMVKPAKADALQGFATTLCLFDEVHLAKPGMWQAMVKGTTAKADAMVLGITTAGDETSEELKNLYENGRKAAAGDEDLERFGFFCWEAPEGAPVDDAEAIAAANPSVHAGRVPVERLQEQVRTEPLTTALRFTHNRFVAASSGWMPADLWMRTADETEPEGTVWYSMDRTPSWKHGVIVKAVRKADGDVWTKVVAMAVEPDIEWFVDRAEQLQENAPAGFVLDGFQMKDVAAALEQRGVNVKMIRSSDVTNACSFAYSYIARGKAMHKDDQLLREQNPHAVKKNIGEAWRVARGSSGSDIDGIMATINGIYVAGTQGEQVLQVF